MYALGAEASASVLAGMWPEHLGAQKGFLEIKKKPAWVRAL